MAAPGFHLNATCAICKKAQAIWMCKCANEPLCQDCISTHFSKAAVQTHLLADYQTASWVTNREVGNCLEVFDKAAEVAQFINSEVNWLKQTQVEVREAIERQIERFCEEIRNMGNQKIIDLEETTQKLINKLMLLQELDKQEVLALKATNLHLVSIDWKFNELPLAHAIEINKPESDAMKYEYGMSMSPAAWSCDGKIDAITMQVNKTIFLEALGIGKQQSVAVPTTLELLEIIQGGSTKGQVVLYAHNEPVSLISDLTYTAVILLKKPVKLRANTEYTIKAKLVGGRVYSFTKCTNNRVQNGLGVTLLDTSFDGGDLTNKSGPKCGVFFDFYYKSFDV